jgi:hypothetical protein
VRWLNDLEKSKCHSSTTPDARKSKVHRSRKPMWVGISQLYHFDCATAIRFSDHLKHTDSLRCGCQTEVRSARAKPTVNRGSAASGFVESLARKMPLCAKFQLQ